MEERPEIHLPAIPPPPATVICLPPSLVDLPPEVIHHIQSFLTREQARQSALISKSWYGAWLSRHGFYFNESEFDSFGDCDLSDFVKKTIRRYEDLHVRITSFNIRLERDDKRDERLAAKYVTKSIKKLLKFFANGTDGNIRFHCYRYALPAVLREAETIVKLSLEGFRMYKPMGAEFSKLTSLSLTRMLIPDDLFVGTFPCLTDLTILNCGSHLRISSSSLKCIKIVVDICKIELTVPNIHKLIFSGSNIPTLVLKEPPRSQWESVISVDTRFYDPKWFLTLEKLLRELHNTMCKVSIKVTCYGNGIKSKDHLFGYDLPTRDEDLPEVENLTLFTESTGSTGSDFDRIFRSFFSCFHPKFITQYWLPKASTAHRKESNAVTEFLYERLIKNKDSRYVDGLADEARVEIFKEKPGEWQPLDGKKILFDDSKERVQKIRFLLSWK